MMEQLPENRPDDNVTPSLGKTLRQARELLGLNVADVSKQIKFSSRQIEALEADDFQHLPEIPFLRGFVRSYAKLLHLDAQPLLACIPNLDAVKEAPAPVEVIFPSAHTPQRQNLILLGAALLLAVVVVAFAVWNYTMPPATPEIAQVKVPLPAETEIIPASSVEALQAIAEHALIPQAESQVVSTVQRAPDDTLRLVFDTESWVKIIDRNGRILVSQINPSGSELKLNGYAPFSMIISNAASVQLYYRGKQVDLLPYIKPSGKVARLTLE